MKQEKYLNTLAVLLHDPLFDVILDQVFPRHWLKAVEKTKSSEGLRLAQHFTAVVSGENTIGGRSSHLLSIFCW